MAEAALAVAGGDDGESERARGGVGVHVDEGGTSSKVEVKRGFSAAVLTHSERAASRLPESPPTCANTREGGRTPYRTEQF
ncbi:tRNA uridine 5-carboxymethylaminomethyl modification enzyme mnmG [Streptomyces laurentii]|uniref:tRNA uridine 5-carboxymethylaminomethyl modification enzyme mnmG n=1 Tax=Streptomyces laurentii TaxID=39478 RepID=A0A169NCE4_STRLU|nr:tRNA uridine 5-carboxymethylaminomethyl modification enzyme mnmG [Streptomyces laurentii]